MALSLLEQFGGRRNGQMEPIRLTTSGMYAGGVLGTSQTPRPNAALRFHALVMQDGKARVALLMQDGKARVVLPVPAPYGATARRCGFAYNSRAPRSPRDD